jgi:DNA-binding MarR family transcriptional regulator
MPEIDREILDRAVRWCAESGRPTRAERVRAVLETLGWDELLAVKATLADPPPGRNLSPADLVALSRAAAPPSRPPARPRRPKTVAAPRKASAPRIRRVQDAVAAPTPGPAPLPHLDGLYRESGRAEIGRLLRRLGANRVAILSDLASRWSDGAGSPPGSADLDRLLEHHGLARVFAERERALFLHAVGKHGGVVIRMARELGMAPEDVRGAIDRLELRPAVESIRDSRRRRLERKGTLSERARLLDEEADALADLGLLAGFEADLRRRLPDHLRALAVGGKSPSAADLGRSLSLSRGAADRVVAHFGLRLRPSPPDRPERSGRGSAPRRPGARGAAPRRPPGPRPQGARPPGTRLPPRGGRRPL